MKKLANFILSITLLLVPVFVLAQPPTNTPPPPTNVPPQTINIPNPVTCPGGKCGTLMEVLVTILEKIVMPIAAVAVVVWIIWAGFTFITAQGKEAEITKAKARLLWSLIGAGILLGAVGISALVVNTVDALMT